MSLCFPVLWHSKGFPTNLMNDRSSALDNWQRETEWLVGGGTWGGQLGDKWKIRHDEHGPNWGAVSENCVRTQTTPDSKGEACRRVRDV